MTNCPLLVLVWMALVACLRMKRASMVGVGDILEWVAWVGWVVCLCGWHASVGGMSGVVTWMACYYYCYCYYWNAIPMSKMLNAYFWNKNEKMFHDLGSDLKEEPDLKSRCWFTLFGPVMQGSRIYLHLLKYTRMWAGITR